MPAPGAVTATDPNPIAENPDPTVPDPTVPAATVPPAADPLNADTVVAVPHWKRLFPALAVPNYRMFVASQLVASTGVWMQRVAQDWLVLTLTHSPTAVGITTAAQFLPLLLFGLHGGVLADRYPKRRLLLVTQGGAALTAAVLCALTVTGTVTAPLVWTVAFALGAITVVDNPARQLFVNEMVGPTLLRNAISLNASIFQLGGLLGPAAAGLMIGVVGAGWAFAVNAAACAIVVVTLCSIRTGELTPTRSEPAHRGQLAEGLRYIRSRPEVLWPIVLVAFVGTFGLNLPIVLTGFASEVFPTGAVGYGVFNALVAAGSLVAAVRLGMRRQRTRLRSIIAVCALFGVIETVAALAPTRGIYAALLVAVGASVVTFQVSANATVQLASPDAVRGRVMSVWTMVLIGGTPLGAPVIGVITEHLGPRAGMAACGLVPAVAAGAVALVVLRLAHLHVRLDVHAGRGRRLHLSAA